MEVPSLYEPERAEAPYDEGLFTPGNIDLNMRPAVRNADDGQSEEGTAPEQPFSRLRMALLTAEDVTPENIVKAQKFAQEIGVPENVILTELQRAETEVTARRIQKNALFEQWAAQDKKNAAMARSDPEGLAAVFGSVSKLGADLMHGLVFDVPTAVKKGGHQLVHGAADVNEGLAGAALMASEFFGKDNIAAEISRRALQWVKVNRPPAVTADSALGQFGYDFVRSAPQMAAQIAAGGVGRIFATAFMGTQISGSTYADQREKDISPQRAGTAALFNAAAQAPMEAFSIGKFLDIFKGKGFADVARRFGTASGTEFFTEWAQKAPELLANLMGESEKHGNSPQEQAEWLFGRLTDVGVLAQANREGMYEGLIGAAWGGLGAVGKISLDSRERKRQARTFAESQSAIHSSVETTKIKQLAPDYLASALEAAGLKQKVSLPADAILRLFQDGTDIITPMGWNEADVRTAAALGQDIEAPLSGLHAYLDQPRFDAAAPFMRTAHEALTLDESTADDTRVQEKSRQTIEEIEQYQREQNELDTQVERLRFELTQAVAGIPGLEAQARNDTTLEEAARGEEMNPEKVAEHVLSLHTAFARKLSAYGVNPAAYLRKVSVAGLIRDGRGRLVTQEEFEENEITRMRGQSLRDRSPLVDAVYGMIDPSSLKSMYDANTYKELVRRYGVKFFKSKKRSGVPADVAAQMLVNQHHLPEGSGTDEMIQSLLDRDKGRFFQPLNPGVDLNAPVQVVTITQRFEGQNPKVLRKRFPADVRQAVLAEFDSTEGVVNTDTGKRIGMSAKDFREHLKFDDADVVGGLEQLEAVIALPELMRKAKLVESYKEKKGVPEVKMMHRFQAALRIGEKDYSVKLTAKEYRDGELALDVTSPLKLYHHRLEKEVSAGNSYDNAKLRPRKPSADISEYSLRSLLEDVNDSEGKRFFQPLNPGVDLNAPVQVVTITQRFEGQKLWVLMKGRDKAALRKELVGAYVNKNTGWQINLTGNGVDHAISSAKKSGDGIAHMEAVAGLPGLIENAVLVESHKDRKEQGLAAVHRMYAPMIVGKDMYAVKLTVKESAEGMVAEIDDVRRLYDVSLEKKMPGDLRPPPDAKRTLAGSADSTPSISAYSLRSLLEDVNDSEGKRFFQPLNPGVDLNAPVQVVTITQRFEGQNPKVLRKRFPADVRDAVLDAFKAGVVNEDTGLAVGMSAKDFQEHMKFGDADVVDGVQQLEAVAALPNLMRKAILVESYEDKKNKDSNLKQLHRFQAALRLGEKAYSVKLTVKEFKDGTLHFAEDNPIKLYHHRLEKEMPAGNSDTLRKSGVNRPSAGISEYSLRSLLEDVNDSEGKRFLHAAEVNSAGKARGSVTFSADEYKIQLFKQADLSTLLHETGHVFLKEIQQVVEMGLADAALKADFAVISRWLGAEPGMDFSTAQHEQFARGFEAWLREGKAPTQNLETSFSRFKKWLTRIYRQASRLKVDLTDDVRDVFSRLLATDVEIETAAVKSGLLDITVQRLDALGVQGADRVYASGLMKAAKDAAAVRMREVRDYERQRQLAAWAKEAREELDRDPLYRARAGMRTSPLDIDAVRETVGDDMTRELQRRVPGGLKRGGAAPDIFAYCLGYDNVPRMLAEINAAPGIPQRVREIVGERQREHDALYNPEAFLLETDEAAEQVELVGKYLAKAAGDQAVEQKAVARVAEEQLASMPAGKAVRPQVFRRAMSRALEAERRALAGGDFAAALDANTKARLNMEFARRAVDIERGLEKLQSRIGRFVNMGKGDPIARYAVMTIAAKYGLARQNPRLAEGRQETDVRDWIKEVEDDGYPLYLDETVLWGAGAPWRDLPMRDFDNLAETLSQFITVERNRRTVETGENKRALDLLADEIAASINAVIPSKPVATVEEASIVSRGLAAFHSEMLKADTIARLLDDDKMGIVWQHVIRPINKATWEEAGRFKGAKENLGRIFSVYAASEFMQMRRKREYIKSINESLTREERIMALLNCGNPSNRQRLMAGHNWSEEQLADVLDGLEKKDWDFAQQVWDYLESFREESFRLEESLTGLRPKAVEAAPVSGKFGAYRGGYFPVKYNPRKSARAPEADEAGRRPTGLFAAVEHGHLKERSKAGLGTPLYLKFDLIADHTAKTVHNLSFRQPVMQAAKVLRNAKVQAAMQQAAGVPQYRRLWEHLQDVAGEGPKKMGSVDKVLTWARGSMALFTMGYKVTTAAVQVVGFFPALTEIGPKWMAVGVGKAYPNVWTAYKEVTGKSPMMANRIRSMEREAAEQIKRLGQGKGLLRLHEKIKENAFTPMGIVQMGVDLPTWLGAYEKKMKETGGNEQDAVEYADNVVEITQVGGATKDLSAIQRGGALQKAVTMFMSYFSALYNISTRRVVMAARHKDSRHSGQLAATVLLCWFMEPVLSELLAGRGPDEDDGEEWASWSAKKALTNPFQMIPVVRDVTSYFTGESRGFELTAAADAFDMLIRAGEVVVTQAVGLATGEREELDAKQGKALVRGVGVATGSPFLNAQAVITVGNLWDWLDGTDPLFEARDLIYAKPKSRR